MSENLKKLDQKNFAINLKECHFLKIKTTWLGDYITQTGIRTTISIHEHQVN